MVTTYIPKPDPDKVERVKEAAVRSARVVIGGDERAAVRRIILWLILLVSFVLIIQPGEVAALPGLIALGLLVATDGLL